MSSQLKQTIMLLFENFNYFSHNSLFNTNRFQPQNFWGVVTLLRVLSQSQSTCTLYIYHLDFGLIRLARIVNSSMYEVDKMLKV